MKASAIGATVLSQRKQKSMLVGALPRLKHFV
jgi:hypothetical protein